MTARIVIIADKNDNIRNSVACLRINEYAGAQKKTSLHLLRCSIFYVNDYAYIYYIFRNGKISFKIKIIKNHNIE